MSNDMENNNDNTVARWVDGRLATLDASGWQPDRAAGLARLKRRRGQRKNAAWAAVAVAAGCACLAAFPVTRVLAQRCLDACVAETIRARQLLWPRPELNAAPDFILADQSGKRVQLSSFKGQVVLLNFWATWCGGCKVEIPWFEEFQRTYSGAGLVVLGISLDEDGWNSVRPFLENWKISYRVMVGNEETSRLYPSVKSLPTTLLIDRTGRIAVTHVGLATKETYERDIKALLK